jgi:hypothetical protein
MDKRLQKGLIILISVLGIGAVAWPQCTSSVPLVIDDFTTGAVRHNHVMAGRRDGDQSGTMIGGRRSTTLLVGHPTTTNPFSRTASFEIPLDGLPLIFETGVRVNWILQLKYGYTATTFSPLGLDLKGFDRIRFTMDSADAGPEVIPELFTDNFGNSLSIGTGVFIKNPGSGLGPYSFDIPFSAFAAIGAPSLSKIDYILFEFVSGTGAGGDDFSIRSITFRCGP